MAPRGINQENSAANGTLFVNAVLTRRGPLAKVWLAAHYDRKLSKKEIVQASITRSIDAIVSSSHPPALRVTGQLLVGVARIYSRKAKYLLDDCNEAKVAIQLAFRPGAAHGLSAANVDMVGLEGRKHAYAYTTLPDALGELDLMMFDPPMALDGENALFSGKDTFALATVGVARRADITLEDDATLMPFSTPRKNGTQLLTNGTPIRSIQLVADEADAALDAAPIPGLDLAFDLDFPPTDQDIEVARRAEPQVEALSSPFASMDKSFETPIRSDGMKLPSTPLQTPDALGIEAIQEDAPLLFANEEIDQAEPPRTMAPPRKRRRIVDESTQLPNEELKQMLTDPSNILLDNAPYVPPTSQSAQHLDYFKLPFAERINRSTLNGIADELWARSEQSISVTPPSPIEQVATGFDTLFADSMVPEEHALPSPRMGNEDMEDIQQRRASLASAREPEYEEEVEDSNGYSKSTSRVMRELAQIVNELPQSEVVRSHKWLQGATRGMAARKFYEVLLLATRNVVQVEQSSAYGEIAIRPLADLFTLMQES